MSISPDGRWLVIGVARTFDQTDLYLQDRRAGAPPVAVARDLPASFEGEVAHGRLFLRTNLDAPTYRLYVVDPEQPGARAAGGRSCRRAPDAVLEGVRVAGDHLALSYLERASSRLRLTRPRGPASCARSRCPTLGSLFGAGAEWDGERAVLRLLVVHRAAERVSDRSRRRASETLWRRVEADVDPDALRGAAGVGHVEGRHARSRMFLVHRRGLGARRRQPGRTSPATAASTSA